MCYRLVFNIVKLEFADLFTFNPVTVTQGHLYRLFVLFARNNTRKTFFLIVLLNLGIKYLLILLTSVR